MCQCKTTLAVFFFGAESAAAMSYLGLPKMGPVAMEEPENMELLKETAAVYAHVIDKVQAACEPTITQLGYRSLMSQFFADWKTQTYRLLQERAQAPPATVPVARPAAKPEAAKRAHADDAGGDLLLATGASRARVRARVRVRHARATGTTRTTTTTTARTRTARARGGGARARRAARRRRAATRSWGRTSTTTTTRTSTTSAKTSRTASCVSTTT